jgi:hypothetical protein
MAANLNLTFVRIEGRHMNGGKLVEGKAPALAPIGEERDRPRVGKEPSVWRGASDEDQPS